MTTRADIARGKGATSSKQTTVIETVSEPRTIILPNFRKMCSIFLFFIGSFAIGFGAGFGSGYAAKICETA
tara:strand:+ start:603 stop:815 length:213 start_codon:yes stop_codon:yes gene_type:complete